MGPENAVYWEINVHPVLIGKLTIRDFFPSLFYNQKKASKPLKRKGQTLLPKEWKENILFPEKHVKIKPFLPSFLPSIRHQVVFNDSSFGFHGHWDLIKKKRERETWLVE
jgi:hypothetical protein